MASAHTHPSLCERGRRGSKTGGRRWQGPGRPGLSLQQKPGEQRHVTPAPGSQGKGSPGPGKRQPPSSAMGGWAGALAQQPPPQLPMAPAQGLPAPVPAPPSREKVRPSHCQTPVMNPTLIPSSAPSTFRADSEQLASRSQGPGCLCLCGRARSHCLPHPPLPLKRPPVLPFPWEKLEQEPQPWDSSLTLSCPPTSCGPTPSHHAGNRRWTAEADQPVPAPRT